VVAAGANVLVAGNSVFAVPDKDYARAIAALRRGAARAGEVAA
jgi:pentose-5-phosphate-3-epimerase